MSDLTQTLFSTILGDFSIDFRQGSIENEEIARVSDIAKNADIEYLTRVMESAGYHPMTSNQETAGYGIMQFSNRNHYEEMANALNAEDDDEEQSDDSEGDVRYSPKHGRGVELSNVPIDGNISIDGDGKNLRVLTDVDSHKFADKLYTQTLGNYEDRSSYAAFLYAFDNFLSLYKNQNPEPEAEEASASKAASKLFINKFITQFSPFITGMDGEVAKEKSARSQVLKELMKLMSGKHGVNLTAAWEAGDIDAAGNALGSIMENLLEAMPVEEDEEAEEETESEDDDAGEPKQPVETTPKETVPSDVPSDLTL